MKINFNILNQEVDLTRVLSNENERKWWFNNSIPEIPLETKIEDLTEEQKISLVKLAIYEGYLDNETLCNLPNKSFKINNNVQN
jgi:hypothetical protein